jgi:hypothetical protein
MPDEIRIDWSAASVDGGELTVPLDGKASSEFKERLSEVIARLDRGTSGWGDVKVTRSKLRVAEVTEGAERDLRHFLEAAVQQANANLAADEDEGEPAPAGERSETDERMTEAFRAGS